MAVDGDTAVNSVLFSAPLEKTLEEMTAAELREMAKVFEVRGYSTMNKTELYEAVKAAREG